jgi:hypothetical protein
MNYQPIYRRLRLAFAVSIAAIAISSKSSAQTGYYAAGYQAAPSADYARAKYEHDLAVYHQQVAVYNQQMADYQARKAAYDRYVAAQQAAARQMPPAPQAVPAAAGNYLRFDGRYASAPRNLPVQVQYAVNAVNHIQGKPYRRGGGHASTEDNAYDCSGSVSYALIKAGLLRAPLSSGAFASYGQPGPGRFITIYVKPGEHVFMTICGLRLDTTGGQSGEGPRWRAKPRSADGFIMRHPAGF